MKRTRLHAIIFGVALGFVAGPALSVAQADQRKNKKVPAWKRYKKFQSWKTTKKLRGKVEVGHTFTAVSAWSTSCLSHYTFKYVVPKHRYKNRNPDRNKYRFQFQVRLQSGKIVRSSALPAYTWRKKNELRFSYDSGPEGCWSRYRQKIHSVRIQACIGARCKLPKWRRAKRRRR